jgi:hypothetical protein
MGHDYRHDAGGKGARGRYLAAAGAVR